MGRKPKSASYDWTAEKEDILISSWEAEEYLYNLACKDYKNAAKKQKAYEDIATKIGTTAKVITDRMSTLRTMLGAVRRKEREAKSGSAPYYPTHRDRIIKQKLAFLEKHVKTRKTVSSLPELSQSQASNSDMFSDDGSVSRELLQQYLTPGAVDGFVGLGNDENSNSAVGVQDVALFNIPEELLVNMPIVDVPPGTKIIHLGNDAQAEPPGSTSIGQVPSTTVIAPTTVQAGPSGLMINDIPHEPMDTENAATGATPIQASTPLTLQANMTTQAGDEATEMTSRPRAQVRPKKGILTKNRKTRTPTEAQVNDPDESLKERMNILGEITQLIKSSYGARRNEVEVWGQYMGLKAGRLPVGTKRDRVLMQMEELLNEALYDEYKHRY